MDSDNDEYVKRIHDGKREIRTKGDWAEHGKEEWIHSVVANMDTMTENSSNKFVRQYGALRPELSRELVEAVETAIVTTISTIYEPGRAATARPLIKYTRTDTPIEIFQLKDEFAAFLENNSHIERRTCDSMAKAVTEMLIGHLFRAPQCSL